MKPSSSLIVCAMLAITCQLAACGAPGSTPQKGDGSEAQGVTLAAGATQNSNSAAQSPNGVPSYTGVVYVDEGLPTLYVSDQSLACDSNQLKPGQNLLRVFFSSYVPQEYMVVDMFHPMPTAGVLLASQKYDDQCTPGDGAFPKFDDVTLAIGQTDGSTASDPNAQVLDPNGYHGSFQQKTSGSPTAPQATFKVITCAGADPFEPGPDVLIKCALPGCFPITSSCTR